VREPTAREVFEAKARIEVLIPRLMTAVANLMPWLARMVRTGERMTPKQWAKVDPREREQYEALKDVYYKFVRALTPQP